MNSKQLWEQDIEDFGNPVPYYDSRKEAKSFDFYYYNRNTARIWYIHSGNVLTRLTSLGDDGKEYHWILSDKQVDAFYRDWESMRNV